MFDLVDYKKEGSTPRPGVALEGASPEPCSRLFAGRCTAHCGGGHDRVLAKSSRGRAVPSKNPSVRSILIGIVVRPVIASTTVDLPRDAIEVLLPDARNDAAALL